MSQQVLAVRNGEFTKDEKMEVLINAFQPPLVLAIPTVIVQTLKNQDGCFNDGVLEVSTANKQYYCRVFAWSS